MMHKLISVLLGCMLLFASCSPLQVALKGDGWQNPETFPVKGRNGILIKQRLSFADYATSTVERSWTRTQTISGHSLIGAELVDKKQTLHFSLSQPGNEESQVFCASRFQANNFYLGKNPNSVFNIGIDLMGLSGDASSNLYYVEIYLKNQSIPWQLVLDNQASQRDRNQYIGYLARDKNNYYKLLPLTEVLDKKGVARRIPFGSVGFQLVTPDDRPVAAVNLTDNGQVYFNATATKEERFLMANVCTAILLQQAID